MVMMERDAKVGGGRRRAGRERLREFAVIVVGVKMVGWLISATTTSFIYFLMLWVFPFYMYAL